MVLAAAAPEPSPGASRLADALAAADPVDQVLRHGVVEALPVLLGDEDPGEHRERRTSMREHRDGKRHWSLRGLPGEGCPDDASETLLSCLCRKQKHPS